MNLKASNNKGHFITLEGGDGSGKTTQIELLSDYLRGRGIDAYMTREPGGTRLGEALRDIILHSSDPIDDKVELLLMFAARSQHITEVIKPRLASGQWVLSDRFTDATFAYQGGGRQVAIKDIEGLQIFVQGDFTSDKTILLDLPVEQGILRLTRRGEAHDRIEQQDLAFKRRVREAYLERYRQCRSRIALVDASGTIAQVHQAIRTEVENMMSPSEQENGG
ncbi:MAG TPA: dTMP kinase [Gammaproteobacteria bacterium]|jgi:dTMP kinase|nr:dTMP kinase [Gammaproteobacteria bacterium]HIA41368.1 dTMP kinase [Gammaproteobacteria bacterium]HIC21548.1 dTMP kinase [Gammaproteobacteria bacterium]HIM97008.1 dTMP kinase [Gammaproteobacteria bacterium]HIN42830.1 dTMP kinase [Gammaproteobacteria bacterium]|tara:strand:+ start:1241 stop:1906 length:666 start_codon:yes stop_codon:yes gene_type:complete